MKGHVSDWMNTELYDIIHTTTHIWVDIDGVLVDTLDACIRKVASQFWKVLRYNDWRHWNPHENLELQKVWIETQEDTVRFFHDIVHNPEWKIPPISGAVEWIDSLVHAWKQLIAVTGRSDDTRDRTMTLLNTYFQWQFQRILFSNHDVADKKKPKSQVARENDIGLMIEDNIHYAIELAQKGIPTVLLTRPWNQDTTQPTWLPIFRVRDWQELQSLIS